MSIRAWFGIGFLLLLAGAIAACSVQTARLKHAKADQLNPATHRLWKDEARESAEQLRLARADLVQCQANRAGLQVSLTEQSGEVDRWKAAAAQAKAESAAAVATAHAASATAARRATEVLTARPSADLCRSADDVILGSVR